LNRRFYRIGQFADKASVTVRALRYYDRVGLLSPSQHTESGYRLYTEQDLLTLQQILSLKFLGFSLEEIKLCLHAEPKRFQEALVQQKALLREKRSQLDAILGAIEEIESRLEAGDWDWESLAGAIQVKRIMSTATTLSEALKGLENQLVQDNRQQFVPLLEERSVQEAIRVAQAAYEPLTPGKGEHYYRSVIQPLLQQIVDQGAWPGNAEFDAFYELPKDNGVTYQGLGVSLEIWTPDEAFKGFSLPVLDVWYGRWVE